MEKFRSKILACFLAVALVVLTTPISLNLDTDSKSIEIQANKAHAIAPVVGVAGAFLADVAAACGLTVSQLVATVVGVTAVGCGMGIANDAGVSLGNSASDNLSALIDAADYPAWDTLTNEQQQSWGTKENYDSAKFNSLLDAFGLDDARERFYSSDGGNIDYSESELAIFEKLGRIGANWVNNGSNTINDILSSFAPGGQTYLRNMFTSSWTLVHGSDYDNWPSGCPSSLYVTSGSQMIEFCTNNNSTSYVYVVAESNSPVYWIPYYTTTGTLRNLRFWAFSLDSFSFNAAQSTFSDSATAQPPEINTYPNSANIGYYNNHTYYYRAINAGTIPAVSIDKNFMDNGLLTNDQRDAIQNAIPLILFGNDLDGVGEAPSLIAGYPDDITQDGDNEVYFPVLGIGSDITWNEFEDNGSSGEVDLTEIIQLLQQFKFENQNLKVIDRTLINTLQELVSIGNKFKFYNTTDELKVHDAGVYDGVGHIYSLMEAMSDQLDTIIDRLSAFFVTDTTTDVIGDLNFPDLGDKALDLVDTISTLAPFGAMFLISEMVAIMSQVGKIQSPSMVFDFNFMAGHEYNLTIDLSWLDDVKPLINFACIFTLIVGLAGTTARLIELEAAA